MSRHVLPRSYYIFFSLVEPILTVAGAVYAIFYPYTYARELLPENVEVHSQMIGNTSRGALLSMTLGNCFFLLALISATLFPVFKHGFDAHPESQQRLVKGLLIPLAIADVTHMSLYFFGMPEIARNDPKSWTMLIWGNIGITLGLFVARVLWLVGVARWVPSDEKQKRE